MSLPDARSAGLHVARLAHGDAPALLEFCARCASFFEMVEGKQSHDVIAREILELGPPGKPATNKHLFGFSRDQALVAVADLGEDYPHARDWYVSLLAVMPAARERGLGSRLWHALESWIRDQGGSSISLIVQQQNPRARRFWEAHGFAVEGESVQRFADRENRVWCMRKPDVAQPGASGFGEGR